MKHLFDLQLFADGGAAGGASGAGGAASAAAAPGAGEPAKSSAAEKKPVVVYGKQPEQTEETQAHNEEEHEPDFEELIKGKYKQDFDQRVGEIIQKRFKSHKAESEQLAKAQSLLGVVASKYGVDVNDADALEKAIYDDDTFFEQAAYDMGVTVKQYKEIQKIKRENEQLRSAMDEREKRENTQRAWANILQQSEETKRTFPNFDLNREMENPKFARLIAQGMHPTDVMYAVHHAEIMPQALHIAEQKGAKNTAAAVSANLARPSENGGSSPVVFKADPSKLTLEDFRNIQENFKKTGERPKF